MFLGECRLKHRVLVVASVIGALLSFAACGGKPKSSTGTSSGGTSSTGTSGNGSAPSGITNRVLVSQDVTSATSSGGLVEINGNVDILVRVPPIAAGNSPSLMAINPARSIVSAFDLSSNTVYAISTATEKSVGQVLLPGPTSSFVLPNSSPVGYAAVPSAIILGYPVLGAVEVMNFSSSSLTAIAVTAAQTVVANNTGSQVLVFSNDSDSVTLLNPADAVPPLDLSCFPNLNPNPPTNPPQNPPVCTIIPGFDRPVFAVVNGNTAYVLNCGAECGGTQASIQTLDLSSLAVGPPVPVNGATWAYLSGTKLYVAGDGTPTGQPCSSLTNKVNAKTAATYCGTLDIVNLSTMKDPYFHNPAAEIAIPDGYHDRMNMSGDGQLFVGSRICTNIGNINDPVGEVRGCLAILNTNTGAVVIPPDNGDVTGLQSFTSRQVEYVAEGGNLRVYDTLTDQLLINPDYLPLGTIPVVGFAYDVKAIDFF
jgi:hypothetical protein